MEVRFIEFMPFNSNDWENKKLMPYLEIKNAISEKYRLSRNEDGSHATSKVIHPLNLPLTTNIFRPSK
jgi:molybdenum cofactor biosynthesis enzyme MoaA